MKTQKHNKHNKYNEHEHKHTTQKLMFNDTAVAVIGFALVILSIWGLCIRNPNSDIHRMFKPHNWTAVEMKAQLGIQAEKSFATEQERSLFNIMFNANEQWLSLAEKLYVTVSSTAMLIGACLLFLGTRNVFLAHHLGIRLRIAAENAGK